MSSSEKHHDSKKNKGVCVHNVFSFLDISALLEPRQKALWSSAQTIKLRIRSDHVMENSVVYYIAELVERMNSLQGLQQFHLNIGGQRGRFGAAALASVLRVSRRLVSLDIGSGSIYGGTRDLAEALRHHQGLESATFLDCRAFDEDGNDLLSLVQALSENPSLRHLSLDSTVLKTTSGNVSNILAAFGRSRHLQTLKLRNCRDSELQDEDVLPLLKEVKTNKTMKELCIHDAASTASRFGCTLSTALGLMVCFNTTLETLLLSLQPESVSPVINGLRFNKTIKRLQLHSHQDCLESIMETLEEVLRDDNYILEHCQLGIRPSSKMDYYLTLNCLERHFLLTSETATENDWINTISHQDQAGIVLYFMMKNPALFCNYQMTSTGTSSINDSSGIKRRLASSDTTSGGEFSLGSSKRLRR